MVARISVTPGMRRDVRRARVVSKITRSQSFIAVLLSSIGDGVCVAVVIPDLARAGDTGLGGTRGLLGEYPGSRCREGGRPARLGHSAREERCARRGSRAGGRASTAG